MYKRKQCQEWVADALQMTPLCLYNVVYECILLWNFLSVGALSLCQSLCQNALFSSSLHSLTLSKNPGLLGSEETNVRLPPNNQKQI